MAQANQQIYSRLSLVYHLLYNEPYHLITSDKKQNKNHHIIETSQAKQKVKIPSEVLGESIEYGKTA